jgi:hypothetical protein
MLSTFTVNLNGNEFRLLSMHISVPKLFQVYVTIDGTEKRFHLKLEDNSFVFAMPDDCPKPILDYQEELSNKIKQQYNLI